MAKCYDCGLEIEDYVMESRCTGGGGHDLIPSYSYSEVPVHANRKECQAVKKETELWREFQEIPKRLDMYRSRIESMQDAVKIAEARLKELAQRSWGPHA